MPAHVPAQFLQGTGIFTPPAVTAQMNRQRALNEARAREVRAAAAARLVGAPTPRTDVEDLVALRSAAQARARRFNPPPTPDPVALFIRPPPVGPPADFGVVRSRLGRDPVDAALSGQPTPVVTTIDPVPIPKAIPRSDTRVSAAAVVITATPVFKTSVAPMRPPNDERAFVHKRIGGALKGAFTSAITGGNPLVGAGRGFISAGTSLAACPSGQVMQSGRCVQRGGMALPARFPGTGTTRGENLGVQPSGGGGAFVATGGSFGITAVAPFVESIQRRSCPPMHVLGMDGLCYHKKILPNKFRAWPKPTAPLLTGGQVNILRKAASLEKRIKVAAKRYLAPPPKRPR